MLKLFIKTLTDSSYIRHIEWIKRQLQKHMMATVKQLATLDIHPIAMPKAGMFLWCQLPAHIDAELNCLKAVWPTVLFLLRAIHLAKRKMHISLCVLMSHSV